MLLVLTARHRNLPNVLSTHYLLRRAPARRRLARTAPAVRRIPGRGDVEKILENEMAVLRRDALGMELHAMDRQFCVRQPHHQPIVSVGDDRTQAGVGQAVEKDHMTPTYRVLSPYTICNRKHNRRGYIQVITGKNIFETKE